MQKNIKVFVDHQIFTMQKFGGISKIFIELYKQFQKGNSISYKIYTVFSENECLQEVNNTKKVLPNNNSFFKKLFYYIVNRIYSTFILIRGDFDIFQPTYYDPYFLPLLKRKPFVLVVHDMTHELFPETVSKQDKTIPWKRKLVRKADKIIAISENTKRDILKFYNIDETKIEVVYWGTSLTMPNEKVYLKLPKRYLLYVGNRNTYKNFLFFVESISPLLKSDKDLYLICAGSNTFSDSEELLFKKLKISKQVRHIKFKDDKELAYIYSNALCFIFPSLYEGFGLPILEAFACGCPAILSNTSSLPEVGGDAAKYFDPKDPHSILATIKEVVYDSKLRGEMRKKGSKRLKKFNWEVASNKIKNTYEELIQNKHIKNENLDSNNKLQYR